MTIDEWEDFQSRAPALAARFAKLHPRRVPTLAPVTTPVRPTNASKRWTSGDDHMLASRWGVWELPRLSRELGRSTSSIRSRAERLDLGSPSSAVGSMSLRRFAKFSGFSTTKIHNAAAEMGIAFVRSKAARPRCRNGRPYQTHRSKIFALTPIQVDRLLEFLLAAPNFIGRSRQWGTGKKPPACVVCGTIERPHKARGLCGACYQRDRK